MDQGGGKKKVMVAIDGSETSQYALSLTLETLRESIRNSQLIIFTAQPVDDYKYLYASCFGSAPSYAAAELVKFVQENHKRLAESLLEKAKYVCNQYGVGAEKLTEAGDPKDAICKAVEKLGIELLVIGNHGRGALQRAFLGSVSNYCVHNAKLPCSSCKENCMMKSHYSQESFTKRCLS